MSESHTSDVKVDILCPSVPYAMPNLCSLFYFCAPLNSESRWHKKLVSSRSSPGQSERREASKMMRTREGPRCASKTAAQREVRFVEMTGILLTVLAQALPDRER